MKFIGLPVEVDAFEILAVWKPEKTQVGGEMLVYAKPEKVGPEQFTPKTFWLTREMLARYVPVIGDYVVVQADGYVYVNPRDVFLRKYRPEGVNPDGGTQSEGTQRLSELRFRPTERAQVPDAGSRARGERESTGYANAQAAQAHASTSGTDPVKGQPEASGVTRPWVQHELIGAIVCRQPLQYVMQYNPVENSTAMVESRGHVVFLARRDRRADLPEGSAALPIPSADLAVMVVPFNHLCDEGLKQCEARSAIIFVEDRALREAI